MPEQVNITQVQIEPWGDTDLALLRQLNAPEMMEHLGGSETEEQMLTRHQRYMEIGGTGTGHMFRIVLHAELEPVGSVGYWERVWKGETIYEIGWSIISSFQGRGIATLAVAKAIAMARAEKKHQYMHAFPSINNPASNAICRKLDYVLLQSCEFEYPPGNFMQCNDWRLNLAP